MELRMMEIDCYRQKLEGFVRVLQRSSSKRVTEPSAQKYSVFFERRKINLSPKTDSDWDKIESKLRSNELAEGNELRIELEGPEERTAYVENCLSKPNSFLFLNVGSFHKDVFLTKRALQLIEERLSEPSFRFLVTSSTRIMKDAAGNPFAEKLLSHPDKGVVINIGDREPLHFVSVIFTKDEKMTAELSFEEDHQEQQAIRRRVFVSSRKSIALFYASQIKQMADGHIATSLSDFDEWRTDSSFNGVFFDQHSPADMGALWWQRNRTKDICKKYQGSVVAVTEAGIIESAPDWSQLFIKLDRTELKPTKDCYVTNAGL